jgi:hypothetical protein
MPTPILLGTYQAPLFRIGDPAFCEVHGEVIITGPSAAPIPWPIGKRPGGKGRFLVVCGGLAEAVRRESAAAVRHFWGVSPVTLWKWRKALGVGQYTEGTTRLKSASAAASEGIAAALAKAHAKNGDPERRRKISETKTGKPRPWSVIKKLIAANTGRKVTPETRAKMSAAHKARGTRPPARRGVTWSPEEDEILKSLPPGKAALKLRRSLGSVYSRRHVQELPDARGGALH